MNILLAYFGENEILTHARKAFSTELYKKGHVVKELNGVTDNDKIIGFQYSIIFADAGGFFKQSILPYLEKFLKNNDNICSKYITIYINHKFRAEKTLCQFMASLERFGVIIHDSAIIKTIDEAEERASRLEPIMAK